MDENAEKLCCLMMAEFKNSREKNAEYMKKRDGNYFYEHFKLLYENNELEEAIDTLSMNINNLQVNINQKIINMNPNEFSKTDLSKSQYVNDSLTEKIILENKIAKSTLKYISQLISRFEEENSKLEKSINEFRAKKNK